MKKAVLYLFAWLVGAGCNDKPGPAPGRPVHVTIYPNPTSSGASIEVLSTNGRPYPQPYTLLVFNPEGQKILERAVAPGDSRQNVPRLDGPKGNYQVIVDTPDGTTRQKLVKL